MNNIVLIYADIRSSDCEYGVGEFSFGVSILSAVLKAAGYSVSLVHLVNDISEEKFLKIKELKTADLVGISYLSFAKDVVKKWPAWIKKIRDIPVISGGIHPTLNPEDSINIEGMDMILIGEADITFPMLLDAFKENICFDKVPNLWRKNGGVVEKNHDRKVVQNLDELPFLDTNIYDFNKLISSSGRLPYLPYTTSRGCPFNCSYCSNQYLKKLHPKGDKYVRRQSVGRVINELKYLLDKHPFLKTISFLDDMFNYNTPWLNEFAEKYPKEIGLPFRVLVRVDVLTERQAILLKNAGCFRATFGIESGDPYIRNNIMNRKMSNEVIIKGASILKKVGIQTVSYNMVGLPQETNAKMLNTVKINASCLVDVAFSSIFQPHANTALYDMCVDEGYLTNRHYRSVYEGSTLNYPDLTETDIVFAHRIFRIYILLYMAIYNLPKPLMSIARVLADKLIAMPQFIKKQLIKIHDKWFNGVLIDKQYKRLEKDIVSGKNWQQLKELKSAQGALSK